MKIIYLPIIIYTVVLSINCVLLRNDLYSKHMCWMATGVCIIQFIISIILGKKHEETLSLIYALLIIDAGVCTIISIIILVINKAINDSRFSMNGSKSDLKKCKHKYRYLLFAVIPLISMLITFEACS